jgi:hypothetical protein
MNCGKNDQVLLALLLLVLTSLAVVSGSLNNLEGFYQNVNMEETKEIVREHFSGLGMGGTETGGAAFDDEEEFAAHNKKEHFAAHNKKEHFAAHNKKEHFGAHNKKEHFGAHNKKEHFGAHNKKEHFGAHNKKEHFGAHNKKEHFGNCNQQKVIEPFQGNLYAKI